MLNPKEKELLKSLVEKEIKEFEEEDSTILSKEIALLEGEEKYDEFLKKLLEKLK